MSYTKLTTIEKAFKDQKDKIDLKKLPDLSILPDRMSRGMLALLKLQVITEAVNNDDPKIPEWKADYSDSNQRKWFPWYVGGSADGSGSGFRFDYSVSCWSLTSTRIGARLALKDEARSDFMNKHYSDLYKELLLILF